MPLQLRRGTTAERLSMTPLVSELIYDTTKELVYIGNGVTPGGVAIDQDSSPNVSLTELNDVIIDGVSVGEIVKYNGTNWVNSELSFSTLPGIELNSPEVNQVLKYNGTAWTNENEGSSLVVSSLDELTNVEITSLTINQLLKWNGTAWVNDVISSTDLPDNFTGDLSGSVFADDSTMMIDATEGRIVGPVFANVTGNVSGNLIGNVTGDLLGNVTGDLLGNVTGDLLGNVTGDVITNLINSADSGAITVVPAVIFNSDVTVENDLNVSGDVVLTGTLSNGFINIEENTVGSSNSILNVDNIHDINFFDDREESIDNSRVDVSFNFGDLTKTLRINRFSPFGEFHNKIRGTTQGVSAAGNVYETSRGTIDVPTALTPGDAITVNAVLGHDGSEYVVSSVIRQSVDINATVSEGSVPGRIELLTVADGSFGSVKGLVVDSRGFVSINRGNNIATAELDVAGSVKASVSLIPGVYADSVARDTAILAPTAGMIVFVTDVIKFQGYNGTAWTDLN